MTNKDSCLQKRKVDVDLYTKKNRITSLFNKNQDKHTFPDGMIDDYVQFESGVLSDSSVFDKPPAALATSVRVPVQRKNEKYTLQIKIPDPFSTAIISASWDGIYHNRRHVRR